MSLPPIEPAPSQETDCLVANSLRLKNFRPGEYALRITIADLNSGRSVIKETTFVIED